MIFHLSPNPDLTRLDPRIPKSANRKYEDVETPRVCFCQSIHGCLLALECGATIDAGEYVNKYCYDNDKLNFSSYTLSTNQSDAQFQEFLDNWEDIEYKNVASYILHGFYNTPWYYVYIPKYPVKFIDAPVFDAKCTGEVWVQEPVDVMRIGMIYVTSRSAIGPKVKCKGINGKPLYIQPYAYDMVKMPASWVSKLDILKSIENKEDSIVDMIKEYLDNPTDSLKSHILDEVDFLYSKSHKRVIKKVLERGPKMIEEKIDPPKDQVKEFYANLKEASDSKITDMFKSNLNIKDTSKNKEDKNNGIQTSDVPGSER